MKTRSEQIKAGRIWTVYTHESIKPETEFCEGSRAQCVRWLKENGQWSNYRAGREVRLGKLIYEEPDAVKS